MGMVVLGAAPAGYFVSLLFLPPEWSLSARVLVAAAFGVGTLIGGFVLALLVFGIAETAFTGIRRVVGLRSLTEIEAEVAETSWTDGPEAERIRQRRVEMTRLAKLEIVSFIVLAIGSLHYAVMTGGWDGLTAAVVGAVLIYMVVSGVSDRVQLYSDEQQREVDRLKELVSRSRL